MSLFIFPLLFSGCGLIGAIEEIGCGFLDGKDQDHCYQDAAVRGSNFDACDEIKAESFTELQGPAPKDKCYMRVAEKTGDPSGCDKIKGGLISYSKEECLQKAAITAGDPEICNQITGSHSNMFATFNKEECLASVGEGEVSEVSDDEEPFDSAQDLRDGECKYDSDCDAICESDVMWKMGCNARINSCEKTFDTDCSADEEMFGEMSFGKICSTGACVRDDASISAMSTKLTSEKKKASDEVKSINARRDDLTNVMLDTNKNCINGIADMTNVAIIEFSTRIASLMAGGLPSAADAAVDYAGDALNKLYAYSDGTPPEEKKLKPHEYIKLNCDLYNHFKAELTASGQELDDALEEARTIDAQLDALP